MSTVSRTKDYCVGRLDMRKAATKGALCSHRDNNKGLNQEWGEITVTVELSSQQDKDRKTLRPETELGEFCLSPASKTHLDFSGSDIRKTRSAIKSSVASTHTHSVRLLVGHWIGLMAKLQ